ncbi:MAG: aminoacyl-tRNA hydrolase [Clostridia bacterium]|nr:aminoacyl-tRNA hydrolase [Clostridia bacterium]MDD4408838.1 aminoacyl-tRNA hydrolase [Clostridia bacterium]
MENFFLIIGLGNPERKYFKTYHNVGFLAVDKLSHKLDNYCQKFGIKKKKVITNCKAEVSEYSLHGRKILIAKPLTYMNLSGDSVLAFKSKYALNSEQILVIADDVDLPLGKFRFREKGSGGTHNGLKSIVNAIGQDFSRIRIGIGEDEKEINFDLADYVLSEISKNSKEVLENVFEQTADFILEKILNLPK